MRKTEEVVLSVNDLCVAFFGPDKAVKVVDRVSFSLERGEILGIAGESGSGKTMTALALMRLIREPGRIVGGEILLEGKDLLKLSPREMRKIRGTDLFMIFQSPASALNPTMKVGDQIAEVVTGREKLNRSEAYQKVETLLEEVGIPPSRKEAYPFQLSGGMRQRVLIAMALALQPKLLIADEPTTGLDAVTQMDVLKLLGELREKCGTSVILITHDLRVIAHLADRVAVMEQGVIVRQEVASAFLKGSLENLSSNGEL